MDTAQYEKLAGDAREHTKAKIEAAKQKYGLGTYAKYEIDLPTATIRFLDASGKTQITSDIQAAGSFDPNSETFLWAWDNESIPEKAKSRLAEVRAYAEQHEIEHVMDSFDRADEAEAWTVTSIAAEQLNAEAVYRAEGPRNQLFLLLFNIRKASQ